MQDTIVALATPTGRSGIGVIRLSGSDAVNIAESMTEPLLRPRVATLRQLVVPGTVEVIDEAVVTYFKAPRSYTGEDVVELACHGSPVVLRRVLDECLKLNARLAEPGEFSLRALANGRMDLAEAEAVRDLIDARTSAAARQAIRQLRGEFSSQLRPLKDELLDIIVVLESALEFVEDDLPSVQRESMLRRMSDAAGRLEGFAATYQAGHLIRDGLRVAIVGRPNVGKSSLFNALLGSDRAIVTDIPGTTRDHLHERLVINDIPVSLIDTAGLRETTDVVESMGVERARSVMADADLVLVLIDASEELKDEDLNILAETAEFTRLVVLNKSDKPARIDPDVIGDRSVSDAAISISAKFGDGIDELRSAIISPFSAAVSDTSGFLVTDARHFDLLSRAATEIRSSIEQAAAGMSEEIILIGLHNALRYMGQITGETTTEDMLSRIFSTFCIGK
ncbi:MAG: tRNA uridine-5-carboxymethylaminomethyl(34) synthesis GTPase MnmE [Acidobacteria bacterium]|nr:tRNA uridine-5-carboxymethylaminomethyl(34) synthesis GTPase MnmE [Acidobacteriota bacterium]MCW5947957.1 tRNA uridine-5-carboxymethylaminomethyl(34) synthesis GTPase MnmE [Pyrinomonadaceae bacterium]